MHHSTSPGHPLPWLWISTWISWISRMSSWKWSLYILYQRASKALYWVANVSMDSVPHSLSTTTHCAGIFKTSTTAKRISPSSSTKSCSHFVIRSVQHLIWLHASPLSQSLPITFKKQTLGMTVDPVKAWTADGQHTDIIGIRLWENCLPILPTLQKQVWTGSNTTLQL